MVLLYFLFDTIKNGSQFTDEFFKKIMIFFFELDEIVI